MATTGTSRALSGYGWSSNIGWVSFNTAETAGCPSGNCQARVEWGGSGGPAVLVKGWARACSVYATGCTGALKSTAVLGGWDGFISLGDGNTSDAISYGVKINTTTGNATGYAWGSEVVGWIDFSGVKVTVAPPIVMCSDGVTPAPGGNVANCSGSPDPSCSVSGSTCYCQTHGNEAICQNSCPVGSVCYCNANPGATGCSAGATCPDGSAAPNNDVNQCVGGAGGLCLNIPDNVEQALGITAASFPPYRKLSDGRCLCVAGYVLNAEYKCVKPVYNEQ